jgi:2-C-methyl-D-erythritol 4-phosphate cytidylyltransferase
MLSVIIVSAGKSSRMGGINKQLLSLGGIPVIIRSIKAFDNIDDVLEIIVVTNSDNIEDMKKLISEYSFNKRIKLAIGGDTRQQSVFNGFKLVDDNSEYVAIHDGARPLINEKTILELIENVKRYKATTAGVPVKDTIKVIENGFIKETPKRESLFITQTPQVFEKELYSKGVKNAIEKRLDFTDDCQLVESIGVSVYMTIGEYSNIKITTPEDIKLAENFLKEV